MMKYSIKIYLNKEIKAKVNHYFPLEFTEFILILQNLLSELSEKRERVKKFDDQFLAKTDKYLPNFYIIKLQAPSFPHSVQHTYQMTEELDRVLCYIKLLLILFYSSYAIKSL